jgi:hypothetical protein
MVNPFFRVLETGGSTCRIQFDGTCRWERRLNDEGVPVADVEVVEKVLKA